MALWAESLIIAWASESRCNESAWSRRCALSASAVVRGRVGLAATAGLTRGRVAGSVLSDEGLAAGREAGLAAGFRAGVAAGLLGGAALGGAALRAVSAAGGCPVCWAKARGTRPHVVRTPASQKARA